MNYKNEKLNVEMNCYINANNEIWFRGKEIALILGYGNDDTKRVIRKRIDADYKKSIYFKIQISGKDYEATRKCIFINESGLYSLIYTSKYFKIRELRQWIINKVLPSIKERTRNINDNRIKIENENDLHFKVVEFIRKKYPETLMIAGLGENQITCKSRAISWKKGYMAGQCDLMIVNPTSKYNSLCLEFKSPSGRYKVSKKQLEMKQLYIKNKCKYIISNSYSDIIFEIIKHLEESNRFITKRLKTKK